MIAPLPLLLAAATLSFASPLERRAVTSLNQAAFEEAQQRDNTATRAFSGTEIQTSDGKCLFVDELSGDFRANLNPIQVAACDGTAGQKWDIITKGKHNDQAGTILVVNTLTQACANFDPRRKAGNTVIMFSCGGRADGGGAVTPSQLFASAGGAGPLSLEPKNAAGTCLAVTSANVLDQAPCKAGDATQTFTFGGNSDAGTGNAASSASSSPLAEATTTSEAVAIATTSPASSSGCTITTVITMIRPTDAPAASSVAAVVSSSAVKSSTSVADVASSSIIASSASPAATSAPNGNIPSTNPTTPVPVSRAGGVLQPSAAAESNERDTTATRAFTSVSLKSSSGQCLFIDPTAGDFRQNLIPIAMQTCTGSANEKFDLITKGAHNNAQNSTLIVSSLTQGCVNFDDRRAAGDTVILFSCGGRADGVSGTTNSQLFEFAGGNTITLAPQNADGKVCLDDKGGKLDQAACGGSVGVFTIVQ